jgi:aryl-alcohol dehydrogenase-like predicted oxidoreductase
MASTPNAEKSGTFTIGGNLTVNRLGFGAMRITGEGVWGRPKNEEEAKNVLRRAVELGVNLIDTADAYGPNVSEELIGETLSPYPNDLVIATKVGLIRTGPGVWTTDASPAHIQEAIVGSLRRLKLECIDLYQLHRIDQATPIEDTIGALLDLQKEGKIKHIGLSEVTVEEIQKVQEMAEVVSVQNIYNLSNRKHAEVLAYCEENNIGFIPWYPLDTGKLTEGAGTVAEIAAAHNATPGQIALAWLLKKSPVMLPIPGTGSVAHLEENIAAADIALSEKDFAQLDMMTS